MKVTLEKKEKNLVQLEVRVDPQQAEKAYDRAYRQVSKEVRIPGFRPGKAPRTLVERTVGVDYLKKTALEKFLLPEAYPVAVEESKIEPIADPQFELVSFDTGEDVVFKATVEVRPEVKLGTYVGLTVSAPPAEVLDSDVEHQLTHLREGRGTLVEVERPVQMGDSVVADFVGRIDGEEFEGGKAADYAMEVAPGRFIEGFVEAMVGMTAGETKSAELQFPADYPNAELAGKPVVFELAVKAIKEKQLPELDEAFAKTQGVDSVEALREKVKTELAAQREESRDIELRKQVIEKVVEGVEVEVPESMIQREVQFLLQQQANMLAQQGIDPNRVFTQENIAGWRERTRPDAEKRIKTSLTLGEIARKEGILPTTEEIEEALVEYAQNYGVEPAQFRAQVIQNGAWPQIADEVLSNKIIEWLFEQAKVEDALVASAQA